MPQALKVPDSELPNYAADVLAGTPELEMNERYEICSSATHSRIRRRCEVLGLLPLNWHRKKPILQGEALPQARVLDLDLPLATQRELHRFSGLSLICGDPHVPGHNPLWIERLIRVGKREGIKRLAILGDYFDTGAANPWGRNPNTSLFEELDNGTALLNVLARQFETIVVAAGNHERWLRKFLNWEGGHPELLTRMRSVAQWSSFEHLPLGADAQGREIIGIHGPYRQVPGSSARRISEIELKHVIQAHNHGLSFSYACNGQFWAIDCGHLCDERRFSYKAKRKTTHPKWVSGFTMLRDGLPTLFGPHTDWSKYG